MIGSILKTFMQWRILYSRIHVQIIYKWQFYTTQATEFCTKGQNFGDLLVEMSGDCLACLHLWFNFELLDLLVKCQLKCVITEPDILSHAWGFYVWNRNGSNTHGFACCPWSNKKPFKIIDIYAQTHRFDQTNNDLRSCASFTYGRITLLQ